MQYSLVELDTRAKEFMTEKMGGYRSLSRAVQERLSLDTGIAYSIWPSHVAHDYIYSFEDGVGHGILRYVEIREQFLRYVAQFPSQQ
jgi:hypothetical protein